MITDKAHAMEADVVVLAVGEKPYAEYEGDTEDLSVTGALDWRVTPRPSRRRRHWASPRWR